MTQLLAWSRRPSKTRAFRRARKHKYAQEQLPSFWWSHPSNRKQSREQLQVGTETPLHHSAGIGPEQQHSFEFARDGKKPRRHHQLQSEWSVVVD